MRNILVLAALCVASIAASPAAAQSITNSNGQYGDVTSVSGGTQLVSDPNSGAGYAGIYFGLTDFTLGDLNTLSANYTLDDGALVGGAPRFTLFDNAGQSAFIYFTSPTSTTLNGSTNVECNGFGGCAYNYPGISFSDFLTQVGAGTGLSFVTLDVDAGFAGRQQLTVSNFSLNGTSFGTAAVPEPATWAMMLVGFGAIGFTMRRARKTTGATLPQLA